MFLNSDQPSNYLNNKLSNEYIESIKMSTPSGMFYDRDIDGLWVSAEGVIYRDFNIKKHIKELPVRESIKRYFVGVDWGYEHHGVINLFALTVELRLMVFFGHL